MRIPVFLFVQWKAVLVAISLGIDYSHRYTTIRKRVLANVRVTSPAPSPPQTRLLKPGTRLLIADMDVPKILALMVILLLNLQYSQTQGTCRGN